MISVLLTLAAVVLTVLALLLLVPCGILLAEVLAGALASPRRLTDIKAQFAGTRPRVAVLIPAHDEAKHIGATIDSIRPQLRAGDQILVVADNCSDATAGLARSAGARAVERSDTQLRGKGYALDFGVEQLRADPPEVVMVVDADCKLHDGSLNTLARAVQATQRPVQALDLMHALPGAGLKTRIGEFAWALKNQARPEGGAVLGWPCQLMGTGMAFPWALISNSSLATGNITEDMALGLDMARAGAAPLFCRDALVTSWFPTREAGLKDQRKRWETGHLAMMMSTAPRMLRSAWAERNGKLFLMVCDMCVPPLGLLGVSVLGALAAAFGLVALGVGAAVLALPVLACLLFFAAVFLAWARLGRKSVSLFELVSAPFYILAKLPGYLPLLWGRKSGWNRADREE